MDAATAAKEKIKADEHMKAEIKRIKGLQQKEGWRLPEGRIGTLVVMKSGKVKMVVGDGIVMDVSSVSCLSSERECC